VSNGPKGTTHLDNSAPDALKKRLYLAGPAKIDLSTPFDGGSWQKAAEFPLKSKKSVKTS